MKERFLEQNENADLIEKLYYEMEDIMIGLC